MEKADYRSNLARIETLYPGAGTLTVSEVAKFLKCDRHKVVRLIKKNRIPALNLNCGGKNATYRISVETLARVCS